MDFKNQFKTPILFLIFNRPDTTRIVFEKIKEIKPEKLFVAADGPRLNKEGEKEKCEITRKIIDEIDWDCEVKTLFREKNLGCGSAVNSAIGWFFDNVENGIILEDDCVPDLSFFNFCQELLEKYKDDKRVFGISGFNPISPMTNYPYSYFFSYYSGIWGWATWRRAWRLYDFKIEKWSNLRNTPWLLDFSLGEEMEKLMRRNFDSILDRKIDTWDFQLDFALLNNNSFFIHPAVNLVKNIGFGHQDATFTKAINKIANTKVIPMKFPLIHPEKVIREDKVERLIFDRFFKTSGPVGIVKSMLKKNKYIYKVSILFNNLLRRFFNKK